MATSKISKGLWVANIPNNIFTWNTGNKMFVTRRADALTATNMNNIAYVICGAKNTGKKYLFNASMWEASGTNYISVQGVNAETNVHITADNIDDFNCYAIGY